MLITDLPLDKLSHWQGPAGAGNGVGENDHSQRMLNAAVRIMGPGSVLAIASQKGLVLSHPALIRLRCLRLGKRQILFLRRLPNRPVA